MKILITGATGFLGSHLAAYLRDKGHHVGCLRRPGSTLPAQLAGLPEWTANDSGKGFRKALGNFQPHVVVHLAALYIAEHRPDDVGRLVHANIEYGAHLLEAMRAAGCDAMVYAGTSWQHYRNEDYCPANFYAATKQAFSTLAEYYLDAAGLRLLEIHLYDSYGENDPRNKLVNLLKRSARTGETINMSEGRQKLHLIHVDDLCAGLEAACRQSQELPPATRNIYRMPSQRAVSIRELVETFDAVSGLPKLNVNWGNLPYRTREVLTPWEDGEVLPGWQARIGLAEGLKRVITKKPASPQPYPNQSAIQEAAYREDSFTSCKGATHG